jgi:hypothetical protein
MKISQLLFSKTLFKQMERMQTRFSGYQNPPKIFLGAFGAQLRRRCIGVRSDRRELPIAKSLQRFFQKISQLLFLKTLFQRTNGENANTIFRISKPPKNFFGRLRRTTKKEVYRCPERPKGAPYRQIVTKILPENLSTSFCKNPFSKNKWRECHQSIHEYPTHFRI